jgi:hypothetical protein
MGWLVRLRAAVIVAVAPGLLGGGCRPAAGSAGGGWERFEPVEGGDEFVGPGPGGL